MSRFWVLAGVFVVALLGANAASATERSRHGGDGGDVRSRVAVGAGLRFNASEKRAAKFIKRQAMVVANAQPAVFPNARVYGREPWAICPQISSRLWFCVYHVAVYERSTIDPPAEYDPEWPIRQSTVRFCGAPEHKVLSVRRKRGSRKLRVVGGWRMECPLEQDRIDAWNEYGPDWAGPNVSEPTPYEPIRARLPKIDDATTDGLLPAPSGAPPGLPPGPFSVTRISGSKSRSALHTWDHVSCSPWSRYWEDTRYWVYGCFWNPHPLPGSSPGIFNNVTEYQLYYWAGEVDANGWAVGRLFYSGIVPQINYVHG